jgi:hypothetical protein
MGLRCTHDKWDIAGVIDRAEQISEAAAYLAAWTPVGDKMPAHGDEVSIKLTDKSVLAGAIFQSNDYCWYWKSNAGEMFFNEDAVTHWRAD